MTPLRLIQTGLWTLAALLLVATIWPFVVPASPGDGDAAGRRPARPFLVPSVADLALPPLETFSETLNRPLFTATRRPPSPLTSLHGQAAAPGPATPERTGPKGERLLLGTYLLNGIVVAADRKIVMLKHVGSGKTLRVGEGETLDDWTVASVTADQVTLRRGDREEKMSIRERK